MKYILLALILLSLFIPAQSQAVSLSENQQGQVLIFPYYTVNNNLNALYYVVNLTADPKVIKIRFVEGDNGAEVLIFNVYLDQFDVWSGALGATTSSIMGHIGEQSVLHVSADQSCTPFLNKSGQEFLPFVIDNDANNNDLSRATAGHIEIIEIGVLTNEEFGTAAAVSHGASGVPANCQLLVDAWSNGYWVNDPNIDITNPTGGLMGSASLVDVANGASYDFNAVALDNFWQDAAEHTAPGSMLPNLSSGTTESNTMLNGQIVTQNWPTGFEAVSATLMQSKLFNEYNIEPDLNAATEWVVSSPTKNFHVNDLTATPPFTQTWDQFTACEEFSYQVYDRETINNNSSTAGPPTPEGTNPSLCYQTNVVQFVKSYSEPTVNTEILGAVNRLLLETEGTDNDFTSLSGWAEFDFTTNSNSMGAYQGLPVIGFQVQKFTNTTVDALIATYSNLNGHKGILEEL